MRANMTNFVHPHYTVININAHICAYLPAAPFSDLVNVAIPASATVQNG